MAEELLLPQCHHSVPVPGAENTTLACQEVTKNIKVEFQELLQTMTTRHLMEGLSMQDVCEGYVPGQEGALHQEHLASLASWALSHLELKSLKG